METQLILFILLFGGFQSLLLSIFLVRSKLPSGPCFFLLLYLSGISLQITLKVMSKIWLMNNWSFLYGISAYMPLLYGPSIFLFVRHLLQSGPVKTNDGLHFLPLALAIIFLSLDRYFSVPVSISGIFFHPVFRLSTILMSLVAYHLLSFNLWKHKQGNSSANNEYFQSTWLKRFIILSLMVTSIVAISMFLLFIYYPNGHQFRYGFISLSLFVFWVAYNTLAFQPAVANFRYSSADLQSHEQTSMEHAVYHQNLKYLNSNLKDEDAQAISTKLQDLMRSAKPYLNPDLTINRLADTLQCSRHHLSQVLNDKLHQSYNDYVNALRMEEARRMLLEPQYLEHKIASIAYESGFNSLSTFNEVFKKKVGKTPTEYRKEMLKDEKRQRV